MDRTQGRTSSYLMSDIGAIEPGSWHDWHFAWKIGATSFENVSVFKAPVWANTLGLPTSNAPAASIAPVWNVLFIPSSFLTVTSDWGPNDRRQRERGFARRDHARAMP